MRARLTAPLIALAALAVPAMAQPTQTYGPTPYRCFEDSPFASIFPSLSYVFLETFEDGLNTPGVGGTGFTTNPGPTTDSVDCDDGSIDGSGNGGRSFSGLGTVGIGFAFDQAILGRLPQYVGIVWTDGGTLSNITFQAFDATNQLVAMVTLGNHGDGALDGGTSEDRFFGAFHEAGIMSIRVTSTLAPGGTGSGLEVDHLQFGGDIPPLPCDLDLDDNGIVDPDDLATYIEGYFLNPPRDGSDLDGDGDVDPDDLANYITAYFSGC